MRVGRRREHAWGPTRRRIRGALLLFHRGTVALGFEPGQGRLVVGGRPLHLHGAGLFNDLAGKHFREAVDGGDHAGGDRLRERVVDDAAQRFFAQLGSLEEVVSFGLERVEGVDQEANPVSISIRRRHNHS